MRLDSEGRRYGFPRGPNRSETGLYALTTAFSNPHRLRNENSQRKITQWGISSGRVEYLDDFENGNDLAVLARTQAQIREKTEKVWQTARPYLF